MQGRDTAKTSVRARYPPLRLSSGCSCTPCQPMRAAVSITLVCAVSMARTSGFSTCAAIHSRSRSVPCCTGVDAGNTGDCHMAREFALVRISIRQRQTCHAKSALTLQICAVAARAGAYLKRPLTHFQPFQQRAFALQRGRPHLAVCGHGHCCLALGDGGGPVVKREWGVVCAGVGTGTRTSGSSTA